MTSQLSEKHPSYSDYSPDWVLMRDAYRGERQVKSKRTIYLPYTSSQIADGVSAPEEPGSLAYRAYILRARFPGFVREAVQTAIGMMHSQDPQIKLPKSMENIVSSKGENIQQLLRRINEEQLVTGRIGLLLDLPTSGGNLPYIATYATERIINWDDGTIEGLVPQKLNLVVLDESEFERSKDFTWEAEEKYRVLILGDINENVSDGIYRVGVFNAESGFLHSVMKAPSLMGQTLNEIPFVFINSCDVVPDPDEPPLLDLGNLCMTIYRGEADYRQNLFMQGQDTLVVIGGQNDEDEAVRTGAGARIEVPMGGDAKYIGVESDGLSEQREALKEDRGRAGSMGAQSLDTVSRERESGTSLNIRIAARTADLNQVALTGAAGLEKILKTAAVWMGEDPEQVSIVPNLDFGDAPLTGQNMVEMQTARNLGWPISARSLHTLSVERKLTKLSFEEEMAEAKKEETSVFKKVETGDRAPEQISGGNPGSKESEGSGSENGDD